MSAPDRNRSSADHSPLTARLRIEPGKEESCAILAAGSEGESIVRNEVVCPSATGSTPRCQALISITDSGRAERTLVTGPMGPRCICPVFSTNDCVAELECFKNRTLFVSVTVPDRDALRGLIEDLRDREASVHLEQILPLEREGIVSRTIELDTTDVTEKQREAIETAVEAGYYDRPRRADLSELADRLGISESAVSQRLNGAESTLIHELASANGQSAPSREAPAQ